MFNRKEINRNGASGCGNGREKHTFGKRPLVFVAALMLIVTSAVPSFVLADSAGDGDASAAYTVRFCASGTLIKETNVEIPSEAQSVLLPPDALPTQEDFEAAGVSGAVLGWTSDADEAAPKTVHTADESLKNADGYADIGAFAVSGDTVFEAVSDAEPASGEGTFTVLGGQEPTLQIEVTPEGASLSNGTPNAVLTLKVTNTDPLNAVVGGKVAVTLPAELSLSRRPVAMDGSVAWIYGAKTFTYTLPSPFAPGAVRQLDIDVTRAVTVTPDTPEGDRAINVAGSATGFAQSVVKEALVHVAPPSASGLVSAGDNAWTLDNWFANIAYGTATGTWWRLINAQGKSFANLTAEVKVLGAEFVETPGGRKLSDDPDERAAEIAAAQLAPWQVLHMFDFYGYGLFNEGTADGASFSYSYNGVRSTSGTANPPGAFPITITYDEAGRTYTYNFGSVNGKEVESLILMASPTASRQGLGPAHVGFQYAVEVTVKDTQNGVEIPYVTRTARARIQEPTLDGAGYTLTGSSQGSALKTDNAQGEPIGRGDGYQVAIGLSTKSTPLYGMRVKLNIPAGASVDSVSSNKNFAVSSVVYERRSDGTAGNAYKPNPVYGSAPMWLIPEADRNDVKTVTLNWGAFPSGISYYRGPVVISGAVLDDAPDGARLVFDCDSFTYRNRAGAAGDANPDRAICWFTDREVVYKVGTARVPAPQKTAVHEGILTIAPTDYFSGVKSAGQTFVTRTVFGVTQGELSDPFVFYIVPDLLTRTDADAKNSPYLHGNILNTFAYQHYDEYTYALHPDAGVKVTEKPLGNGYKLICLSAPGRTLRGKDLSIFQSQSMHIINTWKVGAGLAAGDYPVYVGMGSLTEAIAETLSTKSGAHVADVAKTGFGALENELRTNPAVAFDGDFAEVLGDAAGVGVSAPGLYLKKTGFSVALNAGTDSVVMVRPARAGESAWVSSIDPQTGLSRSVAPQIPGYSIDVRIGLNNVGTRRYGELELTAVMPGVGDRYAGGEARNSMFDLVPAASASNFKVMLGSNKEPGAAPAEVAGTQYTLLYSDSPDPGENDWTYTPAGEIRAVKVKFADNFKLAPAQIVYLQFGASIRADAQHPRTEGNAPLNEAFASMRYAATVLGAPVSGETGSVRLQMAPKAEKTGQIEGRVYYDKDGNGSTDPAYIAGSSGIPKVQLTLWKSKGGGTDGPLSYAAAGTTWTTFDVGQTGVNAGDFVLNDIAYDSKHFYRVEVLMPGDSHVRPLAADRYDGRYRIETIDGEEHIFVDFGDKGTDGDPTAVYITDEHTDPEDFFMGETPNQNISGCNLPFTASTPLAGRIVLVTNKDNGNVAAGTEIAGWPYTKGYTVRIFEDKNGDGIADGEDDPVKAPGGAAAVATADGSGAFYFPGGLAAEQGWHVLKFYPPAGASPYEVYGSAGANGLLVYLVPTVGATDPVNHGVRAADPYMRYTEKTPPEIERTDATAGTNPSGNIVYAYKDLITPLDPADVRVTLTADDLATDAIEETSVTGAAAVTNGTVGPNPDDAGRGTVTVNPALLAAPYRYTLRITVTDKAGNAREIGPYAFTKNAFAVTYGGNGSTGGAMPAGAAIYKSPFTLAANAFSRAGYTFAGWNGSADGTGAQYADGAQFDPWTRTGDLALFAQWTANPATVTFYNNYSFHDTGVYAAGASANAGRRVDDKLVRPADPTRPGYTFQSWHKDRLVMTDVTAWDFGQGAVPVSGTVDLFAKWAPDYGDGSHWFNVTYSAETSESGTAPTDGTEYEKGVSDTVKVKDNTGHLSRAGYTFKGWNTEKNAGSAQYAAGDPDRGTFEIKADTTLYPVWEANTYTLTFNKNAADATGGTPSKNVTYGAAVGDLPGVGGAAGAPVRAGYAFAGWSRTATGTPAFLTASDVYDVAGNTPLYAVWDVNGDTPYRVEHYLVNAAGVAALHGTEPAHLTKGQTDTVVYAAGFVRTYAGYAVRPGYSNGADAEIAEGRIAGDGSLVLRLYYTLKSYAVNYDLNGGTGNFAPRTATWFDAGLLPAGVPVRANHAFAGWTADGTAVTETTALRAIAADDAVPGVTLTAQWTAVPASPPAPGGNPENPAAPGAGAGDDTVTAGGIAGDTTPNPENGTSIRDYDGGGDWGGESAAASEEAPRIFGDAEIQALSDAGVPVITMGEFNVPLYGKTGVASYGLLNLILLVAMLVIAVQSAFRFVFAGRRAEALDVRPPVGARAKWFIPEMLVAIAGTILFLLTEKLGDAMTLVDSATPVQFFATGAVIVLHIGAFRAKRTGGAAMR